jgi:adenosine deaminase
MAREEGFLTVAHAGEEGPADYIWEALHLLKVARIDHGVRSVEDELLLEKLSATGIPLTVCPLSNLKLQVVKEMKHLPMKKLLQKEIVATINSDDPAYFGGYVNENFHAVAEAFNLTREEITQLAKNSFKASFLDEESKTKWIEKVDLYNEKYMLIQ